MNQFGWWCSDCVTFYFDFVSGGDGICPYCDGYMTIRFWPAVYNEQREKLKGENNA